MKRPNERVRELIIRRKRFSSFDHARQQSLCSPAEYSDVPLMGWSPEIKARKVAAYKAKVSIEQKIQDVLKQCCVEHPSISIDPDVLGGIPHLQGTRLSVGQIIGRVKAMGSIKAVVDYYAPDISEQDVKEIMAYAQKFIERACDPYQTYD